jgi:hypothetical protein
MTEEFLYYIWMFRLFDKDISTTSGESINILKSGERNTDSGPDFFNAKIKIGDTTWAGNVEIHVNSSDWYKHNHQENNAFDNIILHIVYKNDAIIKRKNSEIIPTIELNEKFDKKLYYRYKSFMTNKYWIPCQKLIGNVDEFSLNSWLERLLIERLEHKAKTIESTLNLNKNNWEQTFYQYLARNFGFNTNAEPFELLAKSLPVNYLAKHKNNQFQIESLLFGQAGLLETDFKDEYPNNLKKEYNFLRKKFFLKPVDGFLWKFLRLRPSNFPTIRISQFANLIYKSSALFSKIIKTNTLNEVCKLFDISTSGYWDTHYIFDKPSAKRKKSFGNNALNLIIINTIVPFLFVYSLKKDNYSYKEKALQLLSQMPGEKNSIIRKWQELGLRASTAYTTQSLLELKNCYCNEKKCLNCQIGNILLRGI